jgi:hypothetical protein
MRKPIVFSLLFFVPFAGCGAESSDLELVSSWLPLSIKSRWVYDHEVKTGPAGDHVIRWRTVESIVDVARTPSGTLIRRSVKVEGMRDSSWLARYGEGSYLIRGTCLYFVDVGSTIDGKLATELVRGEVSPAFCFPLEVGRSWGSRERAMEWKVAAVNDTHAARSGVVFEIMSTAFTSGDSARIWFEKGMGVTRMIIRHEGSHFELRKELVRLER